MLHLGSVTYIFAATYVGADAKWYIIRESVFCVSQSYHYMQFVTDHSYVCCNSHHRPFIIINAGMSYVRRVQGKWWVW
jgi:hypothetical protein